MTALPTQIVFHNMPWSEAVEAKVRERAQKLAQFSNDVRSCRVLVEPAHKHHHKGIRYQARIEVRMKGAQLLAGRDQGLDPAHEDVYVAIRDSFDAMERKVGDHARRRRGDMKHHAPRMERTAAL